MGLERSKQMQVFAEHEGNIKYDVSLDGTMLASYGEDNQLKLIDLHSCQVV